MIIRKRIRHVCRYIPLLLLTVLFVPAAPLTAEGQFPPDGVSVERPAVVFWPRNMIPVHAVIVFTRFQNEYPANTVAPSWADELFSGAEGSVNDYFDKVSFGRIVVTGEHTSKIYELPHPSEYYANNLGEYSLDTLKLLDADPDFNFSKYDNDGPDGIPGSSDDDGWVDYMILMPRTRPVGFIKGLATGNATLRLASTFYSSDKNSEGFLVKADAYSGAIATAKTYNEAMGTAVAEISHAYGTVDQMDKDYTDPESDSAGVGNWDLLGRGALGWLGNSYAVGPNAYNRWIMGCVGINNDGVTDLYGLHQDVRVRPIGTRDGDLYRIWISENEYFLIENRRNDSIHYDREIPGNGLMIWHIHEIATNDNEFYKLCDLECADGRYGDKGYPLGIFPDPLNGGDNLDYWSHNTSYMQEYGGNAGDATDVFDGVVYTEFGSNSNPNSYSKAQDKTGIEIFNIRRDGDDMLFDCSIPPLQPWFNDRFPLIGTAVQRFSAPNIAQTEAQKTVFAVFSAQSPSPDILVTMDGDDLSVMRMQNMEPFLVERMIAEEFIADDARDSRIDRQAVSTGEFTDRLAGYGLTMSDVTGDMQPAAVVRVTRTADNQAHPQQVVIMQNYPNPFNASTTIPYVLGQGGDIVLEVYNVLGQRVVTLDQGYREAGVHEVHVDANGFASGLYFYRFGGSMTSPSKRFMLIK